MAGSLVGNTPAITPIEKGRVGYIALSLSNYDNNNEPQGQGNIEVAGGLYEFGILESITGWAGISNSTDNVYIKTIPAGTSITLAFTTTAPAWSDVKQGWYSPTGGEEDHRYTNFKLDKDGSGNYINKREFSNMIEYYKMEGIKGDLDIDGNVDISDGIRTDQTSGQPFLKTKVIEIGDWNMNTTAVKNVAHGLLYTKIRSVNALIRNDGGTSHYDFATTTSESSTTSLLKYISISATNINMSRNADGFFDTTTFDSTSYNRGWITIMYEV